MDEMKVFILGIMAGLIIAYLISQMIRRKRERPSGILRIDETDPDGPFLFLELEESVRTSIGNKDRVVFLVQHRPRK